MITLCMDTSHKLLALSLIKDDEIIADYQNVCLKKQSELIFEKLEMILNKANIKPMDINRVVITKGPGSYTGVRIAMSVAKVICSINKLPLYTIDTLQLYSGNFADVAVVMDARGNRAYYGEFNCGKVVFETCVLNIDEIKARIKGKTLIGDLSVLGMEENYPVLSKAFLALKDKWEKVDNIHMLTPKYLKEASEYMVKL